MHIEVNKGARSIILFQDHTYDDSKFLLAIKCIHILPYFPRKGAPTKWHVPTTIYLLCYPSPPPGSKTVVHNQCVRLAELKRIHNSFAFTLVYTISLQSSLFLLLISAVFERQASRVPKRRRNLGILICKT